MKVHIFCNNSVRKELARVQRSIGYCPQFDALYDELTAREHLYLYARLRGVPPKDQKRVSYSGYVHEDEMRKLHFFPFDNFFIHSRLQQSILSQQKLLFNKSAKKLKLQRK